MADAKAIHLNSIDRKSLGYNSYSGRGISKSTVRNKGETPSGSYTGFTDNSYDSKSPTGSSNTQGYARVTKSGIPNKFLGSKTPTDYSGASAGSSISHEGGQATPIGGEPRSGSGDHTANLDTFRSYLEKLKEHCDVQYDDLSVTTKEFLAALMHIHKLATPDDRMSLDHIIDDVLLNGKEGSDITKFKPGTVGAKFYGCRTSSCDTLPLGCSPTCAGSLPSDPNLSGWAKCAHSVFNFDGRSLSLLSYGEGGSSSAYIYVKSPFNGFSLSQIAELRKKGIAEAKVIHYDDDNCTHSTEFLPIDKLRSPRGSKPSGPHSGSKASEDDSEESSSAWFWWVILGIIVLFAIGGLIWFFAKQRSKSKTAGVEGKELVDEALSLAEPIQAVGYGITNAPSSMSAYAAGASSGLTPRAQSPIFSTDVLKAMAQQMRTPSI